MEKPKLYSYYDYYQCRLYIGKKLNSILGLSFDDYVENHFGHGDGGMLLFEMWDDGTTPWVTPILQAFKEEFGEDASYLMNP